MEPQLTNRQWTEQEVMAAAVVCGYTDAEAKLYFLHYDCQDWKRANGQAITKVQTHMQWCKATGNMPAAREEKSKIKKLPQHFGKGCGENNCGMPSRHKTTGSFGDNHYCIDCIKPKARAKLSSQRYTRDNGEPL